MFQDEGITCREPGFQRAQVPTPYLPTYQQLYLYTLTFSRYSVVLNLGQPSHHQDSVCKVGNV